MKKEIDVAVSERTLAHKKSGGTMKFWGRQLNNINIHQVVIVTTLKENGLANAAPKSWHMPSCDAPNIFAFACGEGHHTYTNILREQEFAVNYPTIDLERNVWQLNKRYPLDVDELAAVGLASEKPTAINAPLIQACPVNFECRLYKVLDYYPGMSLVLGEVVAARIDRRLAAMNRNEENPFVLDKKHQYFYLTGL